MKKINTVLAVILLIFCGNLYAGEMFYDAGNKRIYISCGEGFIDVVQERDNANYNMLERIPTAPGARTSLFVPETGVIYLAVPARGTREAQVWVYETR